MFAVTIIYFYVTYNVWKMFLDYITSVEIYLL